MKKNRIFNWVLVFAVIFTTLGISYPAKAAYNAPALQYPANNQVLTNYPRMADFRWTSIYGANNYQVEIACDVCVSKTNKWQNARTYNVVGNAFGVTVPGADNQFRWRVRAVGNMWNNQVGQWSEYRYFTFNTKNQTKLNTPSIYLPENGQQYNQSSIYFDWSDITGATKYNYEVQKWNSSMNQWEAKDSKTIYSAVSGASYNISVWGDGQFRFRVNAENNSANKSEWSSWRYFYNNYSTNNNNNNNYFSTTPPTLISPADESTVNSNGVSLDWSTITDATSYEYQVTRHTGTDWVSVSAGTVTDSNAYVTLPHSTYGMYSFRVRAIKNSNYSNWSEYNQFYYSNSSAISKPSITFPSSNGETFRAEMIIIEWIGNPPINQYELQKYNYSSNNWELKTSGALSSSDSSKINEYELLVATYGEGRYRVRARMKLHPTSNFSEWSDWRDFYLYNPTITTAPTINQPSNNQVISGNQVNITWNNVSGVSQYGVFVAPNEFTSQTGGGHIYYDAYQNSYIFEKWTDVEKYLTKVCLMFGPNQYGACSPVRYFELNPGSSNTISAPTVYDPYNGEIFTSNSVYMSWSVISGAVSYEVEIDYKSGSYWYDEGTYPTSYQNFTKVFNSNNDYRMRVRAKYSDSNYSNYSDWRYFNVGQSDSYYNPQSPPTITEPYANQYYSSGQSVTVRWNSVSNATSYNVRVEYKSGSNWLIESNANVTALYLTKYFNYTNEYRVQVRANFSDGNYTNWSDYRYFNYNTASSYSYTAPVISTPTENQTLYSRYVFPTWNTVSGAVSYEINVNYKSGTGWLEEGLYTSVLTSVGLDLKYTNEYRVRVRAKFSDGTYTSWSDWRLFRVQL